MSDNIRDFLNEFKVLYEMEIAVFEIAKNKPDVVNYLVGKYNKITNNKFSSDAVRLVILGMIKRLQEKDHD